MNKTYTIEQAWKETSTGHIVKGGWDLMCDGNWCQRFWYKRDAKAAMEEAKQEDLQEYIKKTGMEAGSMWDGWGKVI
jgi:hypothetical protein